MAPLKSSGKKAPSKGFVVGRAKFEKISAVEGIKTSAASKRMFSNFEHKGMSNAARRAAIFKKYATKA
jgi:hypothetical protein